MSIRVLAGIIGGLIFVAAAWAFWPAGEGDLPLPPAHLNDSTLKKLGNLYTKYASEHSTFGPPNEAAFKEFIRGQSGLTLKVINFDPADTDKLFISPRDGKPYVIRWNVRLVDPRAPVFVIHEKDGVDGKREIAYGYGGVELVDEARFRQVNPKR